MRWRLGATVGSYIGWGCNIFVVKQSEKWANKAWQMECLLHRTSEREPTIWNRGWEGERGKLDAFFFVIFFWLYKSVLVYSPLLCVCVYSLGVVATGNTNHFQSLHELNWLFLQQHCLVYLGSVTPCIPHCGRVSVHVCANARHVPDGIILET